MVLLLSSCFSQSVYDLAIKNATVFDSRHKKVIVAKTVLINADTIALIIDSEESFKAREIINANIVDMGQPESWIDITIG